MIRLATIPSPAQGVWHLGPLPLRGYALCILIGIALAIVVSQRRWKARGGDPVVIVDIATWAVPFGVVGGRVYHLITSPEAYFGAGGDPIKALYIWQGGLGIWGAVILGGVGAWIGCRRNGIKLPPFADVVAPGIVLAQAVGRVGNWFNNELYGRATDAAWGLEIHQWDSATGEAVRDSAGNPVVQGYYHPTFAYEAIWDVLTAVVLIAADRRWKLGHGRVFALYVAVYSLGRGWIETLRIDDANHILGLRLNVWTSIIVFVGGVTYFIVSARLRPGRETELLRPGTTPSPATPTEVEDDKLKNDKLKNDKLKNDKLKNDKLKNDMSTDDKSTDYKGKNDNSEKSTKNADGTSTDKSDKSADESTEKDAVVVAADKPTRGRRQTT